MSPLEAGHGTPLEGVVSAKLEARGVRSEARRQFIVIAGIDEARDGQTIATWDADLATLNSAHGVAEANSIDFINIVVDYPIVSGDPSLDHLTPSGRGIPGFITQADGNRRNDGLVTDDPSLWADLIEANAIQPLTPENTWIAMELDHSGSMGPFDWDSYPLDVALLIRQRHGLIPFLKLQGTGHTDERWLLWYEDALLRLLGG